MGLRFRFVPAFALTALNAAGRRQQLRDRRERPDRDGDRQRPLFPAQASGLAVDQIYVYWTKPPPPKPACKAPKLKGAQKKLANGAKVAVKLVAEPKRRR